MPSKDQINQRKKNRDQKKRYNKIRMLQGELLNKVVRNGLDGLNNVLDQVKTWNNNPKKKNAQILPDDLRMTLGRKRAMTLFFNLEDLGNIKEIKTAWKLLLPYINNPESTSRYGGEEITTHAKLALKCNLYGLCDFFLSLKETPPSTTNTSSFFQPSTEASQQTRNDTQFRNT